MSAAVIQLLVLAAVAIFLVLRLKSVLGTRDGFEQPTRPAPGNDRPAQARHGFEVIDGGIDRDITDHVDDGSPSAKALAAMKTVEPDLSVTDFLGGARGAYEWILMAFQRGDLSEVAPFLSQDVHDALAQVIADRQAQGLTVQAEFVGVRDMTLTEATFDRDTREGEITVRFLGELTYAVRDAAGELVDGDPKSIRSQRDVWTFARVMGSDDPNWRLVATGA